MMIDFYKGYIDCALWTIAKDDERDIEDDSQGLGIGSDAHDRMIKDCDAFIHKAGGLLRGIPKGQAGYDFWLTRNGHGAGFWDRELKEVGDKLTELSKEFGECSLIVNERYMVELC